MLNAVNPIQAAGAYYLRRVGDGSTGGQHERVPSKGNGGVEIRLPRFRRNVASVVDDRVIMNPNLLIERVNRRVEGSENDIEVAGKVNSASGWVSPLSEPIKSNISPTVDG